MAVPTNWPPRVASGRRSIRFFVEGTATGNYSDNAYLFDQAAANTFTPLPKVAPGEAPVEGMPPTSSTEVPPGPWGSGVDGPDGMAPMIFSGTIKIYAAATIYFSFDGVNNHGRVNAGEVALFRNRHEAGIAIKGSGGFTVEAW
jgi:hypothetical protein